MNQELEKYIDLAVADGIITEKERNVLIRKAKELGVDQDELEMVLEAKLHLQKKNGNKSENETSIAATKECPSCGAQNDVIFTNCMFCKTALPKVDISAISNDDLLMKVSEWLGKLDGVHKYRLGEEYHILIRPPKDFRRENKWWNPDIDNGMMRLEIGEIKGNIEKYLNLLQIRSVNNDYLKTLHKELNEKFYLISHKKEQSKSGGTKTLIWCGIGFVLLMIFVGFMASGESKEEKERFSKLDAIEQKIESAIIEKNYEYALIQVEQLNWSWDLNYDSNKQTAKQYDVKRENYKKLITKLMKDAENADN